MSNAQPPVTWLLSVKNAIPYLPLTLESIASQDYCNHRILARDDGSTDGTLDELKRWIPSHIPGQFFSGPSLGLGRSLASLVEQAETELCARIDGDDINSPDRLKKQVDFMLAHPQVGVLGSSVRVIDQDGVPGELWRMEASDAEVRWLMRYACRLYHPTVMFRRDVVLSAGNYRDILYERDRSYEDWDLWLRMTRVTEMRNLPEPLVCYRRSSTSITGHVKDWFPVLKTLATSNAATLFPGVSDPAAAMELWESALPEKFRSPQAQAVPSRPWHMTRLRRAAELLALQCRKPRNYFTDTESFRSQAFFLKRRVLQRFHMQALIDLRDLVSRTA